MNKFWNWAQNEDTGQRDLYLEGIIAQESWWGDEATPEEFKRELYAGEGPVCVHINSAGGDCVAASEIYTMLKAYPGEVTVQIDALAASAASVVAMAGSTVCMSPTALMMIHNPWTCAQGDTEDMQKAINVLSEVKESIINAYQIKTGLDRQTLADLMNQETWMNAYRAKELGFCDKVLFDGTEPEEKVAFSYSDKAAALQVVNLIKANMPEPEAPVGAQTPAQAPDAQGAQTPEQPEIVAHEATQGVSIKDTDNRLENLRF